jgi:hydroxypyruvate reductase/glycerate 2-kinase
MPGVIETARAIFDAAVAAVEPGRLVREAIARFTVEWQREIANASRVIVVGAGKATAAMAAALEDSIGRPIVGLVNVPDGVTAATTGIKLHFARPAGSNHPTQAGVDGAMAMVKLLADAGPDDVAIALISGGGSALLPCPADGVSLADKQTVTKQLHASGATIGEMNCVRKHLSAVKGGRLAQAFRGKRLITLVISDVVGDPLDVIASGPTVPDPTTFAEARAVLANYAIAAPDGVVRHLERAESETPKSLPDHCHTLVIGSNATALDAAAKRASERGFRVIDLGPFVQGETITVANVVADVARNVRQRGPRQACLLLGGETTVTLGPNPGRGGRNQEFVLAMMARLGRAGFAGITACSAGTDGEDGPTDAAGAIATQATFDRANDFGLSIEDFLNRHDAYSFFEQTGGLLKTGLTGTNVMDVRVVLID